MPDVLPPARQAAASGALQDLEARLHALAGAPAPDGRTRARELASLEEALGERALDAGLAADRTAPATLMRWRRTLEGLGEGEARGRVDAFLASLLAQRTQRWHAAAREVAAGGDGQACFEALARATALEREALALGTTPGGGGHGPPDRAPLREALRVAVASAPPSPAVREAWTQDLLDRADGVLTSLDEAAPGQARAHLSLAAEDLRWHERHVEGARGGRRTRLGRKLRRLEAELQERDLQDRLEARFGTRRVARLERLVLWLVLVVLAILFAELLLDLPTGLLVALTVVDTLACAVFLTEFGVKLAHVRGRAWWFARHAFVDLLPALPVGLLVLGDLGSDPLRAGRALRFLRLGRFARYARGLMPLVRSVRALGFLLRGLDRLVRGSGDLLNRDVILHPTPQERARGREAGLGEGASVRRLEGRISLLWEDLLHAAPAGARAEIADLRLRALQRAAAAGPAAAPAPSAGVPRASPSAPALPLEVWLRRMATLRGDDVVVELDPDLVARLGRVLRLFGRAPLRWFPLLGARPPRVGPAVTDPEVVALAARRLAEGVERWHDRWLARADLQGTITPAEFVDRVGTALVRAAFRPAWRLLFFGAGFLLVQLLLVLSPFALLDDLATWLRTYVGTPIVVLGTACVLVLSLGWWLKRLASEATTFYERTAAAKFLPLTESIKGRHLERDAAVIERRVLGPEARLGGEEPAAGGATGAASGTADAGAARAARRARYVAQVRAWLLEAHGGGDATGAFDAMERCVLLHRDALDGALFHASDTRTTSQLLGDPALRDLLRRAHAIAPRERRALRALDLSRKEALFGGPYFWFGLVTRAIAQGAARLIVQYDRVAIPLAERGLASEEERARQHAWLRAETVRGAGVGSEQREAAASATPAATPDLETGYVTTAFHALHFLDDDPRRDREIERRFGAEVLRRLQADRRRLFRTVFGTWPLHARPREARVVNLYRLYETWLAGGKALLLPFRLGVRGARGLGTLLAWTARAVGEVRDPRRRPAPSSPAGAPPAEEAEFAVAVRKIDRMRGPLLHATIRLRARLDVEYLGIALPGSGGGSRGDAAQEVDLEADLDWLDAPPALRRALETERARARRDVRRLGDLVQGGLLPRLAGRLGVAPEALGREALRAACFALRADLDGVRTLLAAEDVVREALEEAVGEEVLPRRWFTPPALRRGAAAWWRAHGKPPGRRAPWRALQHDVDGAGRALLAWHRLGPRAAREEGERRLAALLRHPGRLSEQLVMLRAVQTFALIDVHGYREHVYRLGGYASDPYPQPPPPVPGS